MSSGRHGTDAPAGRPASIAAFTLVELLIVVVILAILASVVVPSGFTQRHDSVASALAVSVRQVGTILDYRRQTTADANWPSAIDPSWFIGGTLPKHPDRVAGVPPVETVSLPGQLHPTDIVLATGSAGAYWYNAANGVFRARVKDQGTDADTLAFYQLVNHCSGPSTRTSSSTPTVTTR